MSDRNQIAVLKFELAKQERMRIAALTQLLAVMSEHHGGRVRIAVDTVTNITRGGVFQCLGEEKHGILTLTMADGKGKPLITPLPSGVTAEQMAQEICAASPDEIAQFDAATLAELLEAYHQNCKRAELDARQPQIEKLDASPAEAPVERCPECWLAFGEHRENCTRKTQEAASAVPA